MWSSKLLLLLSALQVENYTHFLWYWSHETQLELNIHYDHEKERVNIESLVGSHGFSVKERGEVYTEGMVEVILNVSK